MQPLSAVHVPGLDGQFRFSKSLRVQAWFATWSCVLRTTRFAVPNDSERKVYHTAWMRIRVNQSEMRTPLKHDNMGKARFSAGVLATTLAGLAQELQEALLGLVLGDVLEASVAAVLHLEDPAAGTVGDLHDLGVVGLLPVEALHHIALSELLEVHRLLLVLRNDEILLRQHDTASAGMKTSALAC